VEVAAARRGDDGADRMESEGLAFLRRVADGYLALAGERRDPWLVVDATAPVDEVAAVVWDAVGLLAGPGGRP
jgi:dTMP kinase